MMDDGWTTNHSGVIRYERYSRFQNHDHEETASHEIDEPLRED